MRLREIDQIPNLTIKGDDEIVNKSPKMRLLTKVFEWSKQISSGNIAVSKQIFKVFAAAITIVIIAILLFTGLVF